MNQFGTDCLSNQSLKIHWMSHIFFIRHGKLSLEGAREGSDIFVSTSRFGDVVSLEDSALGHELVHVCTRHTDDHFGAGNDWGEPYKSFLKRVRSAYLEAKVKK